jgi:hypothetical protein
MLLRRSAVLASWVCPLASSSVGQKINGQDVKLDKCEGNQMPHAPAAEAHSRTAHEGSSTAIKRLWRTALTDQWVTRGVFVHKINPAGLIRVPTIFDP